LPEPLSNEDLLTLYKIALEEYRFQVRLNWDRTTYHLTLSSGLIAIAAGLLKLGTASPVNLAVAGVFFIGMCVSIVGIKTILKGHTYYRHTIIKKTLLEDLLGLTRPLEGYATKPTLAVGTTVGQTEHLQILNNTQDWLKRPHRHSSITSWIVVILILFVLANAAGIAGSIWLYRHPASIPTQSPTSQETKKAALKLPQQLRTSSLRISSYFGYQSSTRTSIPVPSNPF
jgi:hypothetical protein